MKWAVDVPSVLLQKWQRIVDVLADIVCVPATLLGITKLDDNRRGRALTHRFAVPPLPQGEGYFPIHFSPLPLRERVARSAG
jgi:hypothetical protein